MLGEVVLEGTRNRVVRISQKSRQRAHCNLALSCTLRISSVSVSVSVCVSVSLSRDLESEDYLTLSCIMNEDLPVTCIIDLKASC